jgi:deoxyribodipyrimidine photo-lyase
MIVETRVPPVRVRAVEARPVDPRGEFVLYWMTAFRRCGWNFSLQRSVDWAKQLNKPLVILEALRCDYRWASDRMHHFFLQGMAENARLLARKRACYYPYVEPALGEGKGLLQALGARACVVVGDDFPCTFLPRMVDAARAQIPVRLELVDSNGLLPLRAAPKVFSRAVDFRRFLQKNLTEHLDAIPEPDPLAGSRIPRMERLPAAIVRRWPPTDVATLARDPAGLARLPIDHRVAPAPATGGSREAERTLRTFLRERIERYVDHRNQPEQDGTSRLSPYLHTGHISVHQVFAETMATDGWQPKEIAGKATGSAEGWWGASAPVEAFLDELITWRELGYNMSSQRADYDQYRSLPSWALQTLERHAGDPREPQYTPDQFDAAQTHDPLWNAAQRQLRREGRIHNYLRMLWGKKILHWSPSPESALDLMIELNNRYALDGRNPNSYSGIFWCLGRYDRPWGPERPIFGTVRYMTSENTARKVKVKGYLERFGP